MSSIALNHSTIFKESPLAHGRTKSQAFRQISPEPCKSDYLDSRKTIAILRASAFFTADYQEGLEPSPAVKAATAEYFAENDSIQQWLDESTEAGPEFRSKGDSTYANYRAWTEKQGIRFPLTRPKFTSKLKAKGIICKTGSIEGEVNSVRCYFGIKVVVEHDITAGFEAF